MIRGLYTAVSGMITLENKQNTISNNMANANTPGFKSKQLITKSFKEVLISNRQHLVGEKNVKRDLGKISLGVKIDTVGTRFDKGELKKTDKDTDFAIEGKGFFVLKKGDENFYTRDGCFRVNNEGNIVTTTGEEILGKNIETGEAKPIFVGDSNFKLNNENVLEIEDKTNYKLLTVDFEDYNSLEKVGDNSYRGENPIEDESIKIKQGIKELSNVNLTNEMVEMLTVMRNFETNQKFVSMMDESLGKAANEIGRIK